MKIIVVGATGTIGHAVADALDSAGHEVVRASRQSEVSVNIDHPDSIRALYDSVGTVDGVVCCAGSGAFAPLTDLTDEQLSFTAGSKLLGQVNLVRFGVEHLSDRGVFVLTSGIFSQRPIPGVPALAMANGGVESFTRGAALDLPRDIRICTVSPPFITETAQKMGMPTDDTITAAQNARSYLSAVEGSETGSVIFSGA